MELNRQRFPRIVLCTALSLMICSSAARAQDENRFFRWDIVTINFAAGTLNAGGVASARATDGSRITLTGTGAFRAKARPFGATLLGGGGQGGGTWTTRNAAGTVTGSGTYEVTEYVSFVGAPGTPPGLTDLIGGGAGRAGLVTLRIRYSDGSQGILIVSCRLVGTPAAVLEGISASKGAVHYSAEKDVAGVDANRTIFHVSP